MGFVHAYLQAGRVELVPDAPEFPYSAYVVHSTKAEEGVTARLRVGLRGAVAVM